MMDNDYTTEFISYCKYGNWNSIKRLIQKEQNKNITFNIQRGFKVACYHKQYESIKVLLNHYNLNYLMLGGYFMNYIVQEHDTRTLEYILKMSELKFTPDMHSFIEIPYSHEQYDIIDAFINHADVSPVIGSLFTEGAREYCIKKLRILKINKLKNEDR